MHRTATRLTLVAATTGAALALLAGPASAHVGTSVDEVAAGATVALGLTVGHGCDGSPTTAMSVQIPEGITDATPFAKPGWSVVTEEEQLEAPIESAHGDPVTERVSVITFTAAPGGALPDGIRDTFTINFAAPETPGEQLHFKTVQTCESGENAWIQEYDGTGEEPDSPAPSIVVTEAAAGGEHSDEAPAAGDDGEEVAADPVSDDDDADGTPIAIIALIVGIVALGTGGAALAKARRTAG